MIHRYLVRVRGHLSSDWADWFDGLVVENLPNGEALLSGPIVDQAALHGLLARVRDLGLPLLAVLCIDETPEGYSSDGCCNR